MTELSDELKNQIEEAFNYRGHVTVTLTEGKDSAVEGFLFNRQWDQGFIEIIPKNTDEKRKIAFTEISSIELTGKNHAEAHSDFMKRTGGKT